MKIVEFRDESLIKTRSNSNKSMLSNNKKKKKKKKQFRLLIRIKIFLI